ncbi:BTB/POZ domain [Musa troglodytarum]|uniref:BTB/POZ domain n=1 Tax=Musa troglodytarum TaxID=320322 RepID=A0A9E7L2Z7_9LILI|nr:BTB/POZ domain [Musa troglodytarum]
MEAEQQQRKRRKRQKRKLEEEDAASAVESEAGGEGGGEDICGHRSRQALAREVRAQVQVLERTFSWRFADRAAAKRATHILAELAKDGCVSILSAEKVVNVIVEEGAVPALVKHLQEPPPLLGNEGGANEGERPFEHEVEKGSAFALGLLAVKVSAVPEHQQLIVDAGALPLLVDLLKRHKKGFNCQVVNSVIRRAADAITNLAHENSNIKTSVRFLHMMLNCLSFLDGYISCRIEGGIPPLVELLKSTDAKVQRAAAGALRTLSFKNYSNKNQIVDCNALPTLILMLRSEDAAICYEAVHIVQRGAVRPLIEMLQSPDIQLKAMSVFALGRLAQDSHNQAGIVYNGGLVPLLKLLDSKNGCLQHNAAFALYGIAENEDNVFDFIKVGGVQKLQDGEFIIQATKDCVAKTMKRLEEKINGRVLKHLLYLMRIGEKAVQRRIALALAHLCSLEDQRTIFIDDNGLDLLLELLGSTNLKQQQDASVALYKLARKSPTVCSVDAASPSPSPQVYLGEQYVNSSMLSDVTFLVEGKCFYAHRIALLASSDAFRAMFDGGYREKDARDVEIPNIRWEVFELMMKFIYTGSVEITNDVAQDLLRAADQYLLEGLKRLCEFAIAQEVCVDNVSSVYELSEAFHAISLRHTWIMFILEQFEQINTRPGHSHLIHRIIPEIRNYFGKALRPNPRKSLA